MCVVRLSLPLPASASSCPVPAVWSQVRTPSLFLSLSMAALCGPRGTWAQTRVGCCLRAGFCGSLKTSLALCPAQEASCWGKAKERKSVLKIPGECSQDKYTQPREQEGWKIPDAVASLHQPPWSDQGAVVWGRQGGKGPGQDISICCLLSPSERRFLGTSHCWGGGKEGST